jgi:hypothetical protein
MLPAALIRALDGLYGGGYANNHDCAYSFAPKR